MTKASSARKSGKDTGAVAAGRCACGAVEIEIDMPAFWAWHDHSKSTQRAQGCAYATYVGCWRSKVRIARGAKSVQGYEDKETRAIRRFCAKCGTPLLFERAHAPKMVNIPRALFDTRTGREPRYHLYKSESPEWAYHEEALGPLKGYPGVLIEKAQRKKVNLPEGMF
ncbi:MAG TPA: GFA family protein [Rhizomicrobium sp.]|nr:GFA family protein [Rhizomicrobium sp.]